MKNFYFAILATLTLSFSLNKTQAQCISAVQLDGTNEFLHTPFNNYTFTNFTMEMWINSQTFATNVHFISLYQNAYIVLGDYGSGSFETWADGLNPIMISSATPPINTWHHVAFVYDGSNQIIYVDGNPITTAPTTGAVNISAAFNSGLVIGARYEQTIQFATAIFDDIRIWNIARSQSELQSNMNIGLSGNEPGLIAYYTFEDGIGSSTVTDLTGNGNTLTLYNMDPNTDWVAGSGALSTTYITDSIIACDSITWMDGNTYYADNNIATYTVTSPFGCDSTFTLNLTMNYSTTSTLSDVGIDSINVNGQTYTQTGVYSQILTNATGCDSIITLNLDIQHTGINEIHGQSITLYPNPAFDNVYLSLPDFEAELNYQIFDIHGREIINSTLQYTNKQINVSILESGLYFFQLETFPSIIKFIKQ